MGQQSIQPYRGTRDFYPVDMQRLKHIFAVWQQACELFGYEEYQGPLLEPRELYTTKQASGDEIANKQLYWLTDQGGREVAIRPEMTPTVSRMVGAKYQELIKPIRWYSIANFMRYERPQKGRTREFFQLNIDNFGQRSVAVDLELVEVAIKIMDLFNATADMFEIRINNREWFNYWLTEVIQITQDHEQIGRIIDNLAKNSERENVLKLEQLELSTQQIDQIIDLPRYQLANVEKHMVQSKGARDLVLLIGELRQRGYADYIKYDAALVRGFDYYTGNVFEQFDLHPDNKRSMFGGGRYDHLVELYSGIDVPANGYAPGDVTTAIFLDNWKLWPAFVGKTQVLVTVFGEDLKEKSWEVANKLRSAGINTELYLDETVSLSDQLEYANKKGMRRVVILGSEEVAMGQVAIKDMQSGTQVVLTEAEMIDTLKEDGAKD